MDRAKTGRSGFETIRGRIIHGYLTPMTPLYRYHTPDGFDDLLIRSDGGVVTGLWFESSRDASDIAEIQDFTSLPSIVHDTCRWLDTYFSGHQPDFTPAFRMNGLTPFREAVLKAVCEIPFGQIKTYGEIAKHLNINSAQAIGGAVGWNPVCLIVPCHRVIGANGKLVGYGGGMNNKVALLRLERQVFQEWNFLFGNDDLFLMGQKQ